MLVQANALVKDRIYLVRARRSGRGEFANGSGELSQGEGGAEGIAEERSILTASFPEFIHELLFDSAQGTGCCLR